MSLAKDLSTLPKPARTKTDGWAPDADPRFVQLLVERWADENESAGSKPRATTASRFRHSDAGKCARAISFAALDLPPSDPMDLSGVWNTRLGTLIHEAWQEAVAVRFPDAHIEPKVSTIDGLGSGHIDAVIQTAVSTVCYELKTIGGFAYKMAVGERGAPQGPKHEHIVQASLGAKAVGADEVVIGYLSKEAISVNVARRKGFDELGRFLAEWTLTRDEYLPYAEAEEARVTGILSLLDEGTIAARRIPSPELPAGAEIVDPATGRWEQKADDGSLIDTGTWWGCGYCSHQTRCVSTAPGRIPVESLVEIASTSAPEVA